MRLVFAAILSLAVACGSPTGLNERPAGPRAVKGVFIACPLELYSCLAVDSMRVTPSDTGQEITPGGRR